MKQNESIFLSDTAEICATQNKSFLQISIKKTKVELEFQNKFG